MSPLPGLVDWLWGTTIAFDHHVFLIPDAKLLAVLPISKDRLVLYRFDLDALLLRSEIDYLFVGNDLPAHVVAGTTFTHELDVKSKKGGVKFKVESGPDGLSVSPDGKLTWAVPSGLVGKDVEITFVIADASGQEKRQSFNMTATAPK
jgi:hypothetical protein